MSSFTDKPSQFTPYVSQLPVEAMVSVGMEKQRRYDEGVERIQGSIDRIMELDIAKDGHKEYLQKRLDSLGNNLKAVAGGDFSNSHLVKTVSGMASKLGRDPVVQTAVMSTATYRKERANMEAAKKDGKSNPANDDAFNKRASQWFDDPDLEKPFNVAYTPYFDIGKAMAEAVDKLKEDGYTSQTVFQTDASGENILMENGQPVLSTTMSTLKQSGMFPQKVQAAIDSVLSDPRAAQQIQIDGEYNYKSYQPKDLVSLLEQQKEEQLVANSNILSSLRIKQATATDPGKKEEIQKQIIAVEESNKRSYLQYQQVQQVAMNNPDSVRGMLQRNKIKSDWMVMYTNVKEERTISENPAWRAEFDMVKEANDLRIKQEDMAYKWATFEQGKLEHDEKMKFEREKLAAETGGSLSEPTVDMYPSDLNLTQLEGQQYNEAGTNYAIETDKLLFAMNVIDEQKVMDVMSAMRKAGQNVTREQATKMAVEIAAKAHNKTPTQFRTEKAMEIIQNMNRNPEGLDPQLLSLKTSVENAYKNFRQAQITREAVNKIAPLSAEPTKDELARRQDALSERLQLNPVLRGAVITGKSESDKGKKMKIGNMIGSYLQANRNASAGFKDQAADMSQIVNGEEGSIKPVASKNDVTGEVTHKLYFYNKDGKNVGEMTIRPDEAASIDFNTGDWFKREDVRDAEELMSVYGNDATSRRDPTREETYLANDAFYFKSDFPLLQGIPQDVKGNVQRVSTIDDRSGVRVTKYYPILYVHSGGKPYVRTLNPPQLSMDAALLKLTGVDTRVISALLYEQGPNK